jgi:hypothetical protein
MAAAVTNYLSAGPQRRPWRLVRRQIFDEKQMLQPGKPD